MDNINVRCTTFKLVCAMPHQASSVHMSSPSTSSECIVHGLDRVLSMCLSPLVSPRQFSSEDQEMNCAIILIALLDHAGHPPSRTTDVTSSASGGEDESRIWAYDCTHVRLLGGSTPDVTTRGSILWIVSNDSYCWTFLTMTGWLKTTISTFYQHTNLATSLFCIFTAHESRASSTSFTIWVEQIVPSCQWRTHNKYCHY